MGRASAGVWGPGGRDVGGDSALLAARLLCSPSSGSRGQGGSGLGGGRGGALLSIGPRGSRRGHGQQGAAMPAGVASLGKAQGSTHLGGQVCTERPPAAGQLSGTLVVGTLP